MRARLTADERNRTAGLGPAEENRPGASLVVAHREAKLLDDEIGA
jgi:hypothetical protein